MTTSITKISGIGSHTAGILAQYGYKCAEDLAVTDEYALGKIPGFGPVRAQLVIAAARVLCPGRFDNQDSSSVPNEVSGLDKKAKSKTKTKKKSKKKKEKKSKKKVELEEVKKAKKSPSKKKRKKKK